MHVSAGKKKARASRGALSFYVESAIKQVDPASKQGKRRGTMRLKLTQAFNLVSAHKHAADVAAEGKLLREALLAYLDSDARSPRSPRSDYVHTSPLFPVSVPHGKMILNDPLLSPYVHVLLFPYSHVLLLYFPYVHVFLFPYVHVLRARVFEYHHDYSHSLVIRSPGQARDLEVKEVLAEEDSELGVETMVGKCKAFGVAVPHFQPAEIMPYCTVQVAHHDEDGDWVVPNPIPVQSRSR